MRSELESRFMSMNVFMSSYLEMCIFTVIVEIKIRNRGLKI